MVGRSTVLIKGIAARLGVTWSLANEWAPIARRVVSRSRRESNGRAPRLRTVLRLLGEWARAKLRRGLARLPPPLRRGLAAVAVRIAARRESAE